AEAGKDVPARTMAVVRSSDFLRALEQRNRDCNIDPPTSSYAIMWRARPYRGENSGPGRDDRGELDTQARNYRTQSARLGLAAMSPWRAKRNHGERAEGPSLTLRRPRRPR